MLSSKEDGGGGRGNDTHFAPLLTPPSSGHMMHLTSLITGMRFAITCRLTLNAVSIPLAMVFGFACLVRVGVDHSNSKPLSPCRSLPSDQKCTSQCVSVPPMLVKHICTARHSQAIRMYSAATEVHCIIWCFHRVCGPELYTYLNSVLALV